MKTRGLTERGRFRVTLPEAAFDSGALTARGLRIEQSARMHDLATVRFRSRLVNWKSTLAPGTPVEIEWSSQFSPRGKFFGYVSYVRPHMKRDSYYDFDLIVAGASKALRLTAQRTWINKSVSDIVVDVAKQFRLNPIVEPGSFRRPTTTMNGESYWEFLLKLTGPLGYGLWVDGVNLYCAPISTLVEAGYNAAPVATAMSLGGLDARALKHTVGVDSFTMAAGLANENGLYTGDPATAYSLSPVGAAESVESAKPGSATKRRRKVTSRNVRTVKGKVAHTRMEAKKLAQGVAENGLLALDANLVCAGTPLLKPYAPVYLDLQNTMTSGWWVTKSVVHEFPVGEASTYTCTCVVATDSLSDSSEGRPQDLRTIPLPTDRGGRSRLGRERSAQLKRNQTIPVEGKTSDLVNAFRWVAV